MEDKKDVKRERSGKEGPKISFLVFVSGLMAEGLMAMGIIKNPVTNEAKKDLNHAGMVIDTLEMLKKKTTGNLDEEEAGGLEEAVHHLRMAFVAGLGKKTDTGGEKKNEG